MKHHTARVRRLIAVVVAAVAGLAISSAAYAATASPAAPAAAAVRPCAPALGQHGNVSVWVAVDQGDGTAGTTYYPLEFTNISGHACSLDGYPGVSAISRTGKQLGSPAAWGSLSGARRVVLAPGATAHTILAYHDVGAYPRRACDPVDTTSELRVYLPGERVATAAAFDFAACSRPGVAYLAITKPIRAGAGTING
jgi:hypothetical protein